MTALGPNIKGRDLLGGFEPGPRPRTGWIAPGSDPQPRRVQQKIRNSHRHGDHESAAEGWISVNIGLASGDAAQIVVGQDLTDSDNLH